MTTPAIQNDFSYYRRTLSRMKMSDNVRNDPALIEWLIAHSKKSTTIFFFFHFQAAGMNDLIVRDELANKMSLFYAYPTPMLNSITTATTNFVSSVRLLYFDFDFFFIWFLSWWVHFLSLLQNDTIPQENVTLTLATMATVCHNAVDNPEFSAKYTNPQTPIFCLRVMVGMIILYDHIHPQGAFVKGGPIQVKIACLFFQEWEWGLLADLFFFFSSEIIVDQVLHQADPDTRPWAQGWALERA